MTNTLKRAPARPLHTATSKDAWRSLIIARLPATKVYVEPFARDAAVFWSKAPSDVEVLADDDRQVVAFYKWLRDASDAAHEEMGAKIWTWDSVHFEKLAKAKRPRKKTEDAYRTKYLHLYSVKGDGITLDSSDAARKRTGKSFVAGLAQYRKRLEGVEIVLADAADVLSKYDGADTLFYLDAPDAEDLAESLDALQGKAIITTSGSISLGERWVSTEIQRMSKAGVHKRILAMNFDPGMDASTAKYYMGDSPDDVWFTGGGHSHNVDWDKREASMGGWHAHMFLIDGALVYTDFDGEHRHYLDGDVAVSNTTAHQHEVHFGELELTTELDGMHGHDIAELEWTGFGGGHQHELIVGPDTRLASLTPAMFWEIFRSDDAGIAKGSVPAPKPAPAPVQAPQLAPYPSGPLQAIVLSKKDATLLVVRGQDFAEAWQLDAAAEPGALFERISQARLVDDVTGAQLVDKGQVELGLVTHELRELFIQMDGSFSGHVVLEYDAGRWQAQLSKRTPPLVTHAKTLDIPLAFGASALPSSIQLEIPEALQFWKCSDTHAAGLARRALAATGIGPVRVVDKQLARVDISLTKAAPLAVQDAPTSPMQIARSLVGDVERVIPARTATSAPLAKLTSALGAESSSYLVEWPDSADARADLLRIKGASVWRVRGDDKLYISSTAPRPNAILEILGTTDASAALAAKGLNSLKIRAVKNDEMGAERFVLGIVLAPTTPNTADLQNDWYTAEEIRKACHYYMEHHAHVGWHHHAIVDGKIKILENYVALTDFETTTADGETIKILAGTWIMGFRVCDDKLWADTLASIGGLSIGGWSKHRSAA